MTPLETRLQIAKVVGITILLAMGIYGILLLRVIASK